MNNTDSLATVQEALRQHFEPGRGGCAKCGRALLALDALDAANKNWDDWQENAFKAEAERDLWLAWSDGKYPDDSPGDVIAAESDGTITLDDGITTWNPLRALGWYAAAKEKEVGCENTVPGNTPT